MKQSLEFAVEEQELVCSVHLRGRFTLGPGLRAFGDGMAGLVASGKGILLDFENVEDVDSAGLGELVILRTLCDARDLPLCLASPSPRVVRLLETTRLTELFPHFADVRTAAAWLGKRPA